MSRNVHKWILVLLGGVGYTALIAATYVASMQYVLFQSATGFSDVQMGKIAGVVGTMALIGYLFGGVLSDMFKTKTLMIISHWAAPALLLYMSTFPQYNIVLIVEIALAFFAIFTYWSPMAKFVSDLGPVEEEGKRYGFFYAAASISGTLIGIFAASLAARFDGVTAMRVVYYVYAGLNFIVGLAIAMLYKPRVGTGESSADDKFQFKYVWQVLRIPSVWLIGIMGFAGYMTGKIMVYVTPYLQDSFGISLSLATLINAIVGYGVAVVMSPVAGIMTDKFRSASKVLLMMLIAFIISLIVLIVTPTQAAFTPIIIVVAVLAAAFYAIDQTNWFTPLSEINFPETARGTIIGITSVMMFSSDAFIYNIFGSFLEKDGNAGYSKIFFTTLAIAVVGAAATIILRRYLAAEKNK